MKKILSVIAGLIILGGGCSTWMPDSGTNANWITPGPTKEKTTLKDLQNECYTDQHGNKINCH